MNGCQPLAELHRCMVTGIFALAVPRRSTFSSTLTAYPILRFDGSKAPAETLHGLKNKVVCHSIGDVHMTVPRRSDSTAH